jgi:predicted nuclease of restriction endonuclease-like (RecB) superfamily
MLLARQFLQSLLVKYGKQSVYSEGYTWYPETCKVLDVKHYIHTSLEKSLIERVMQYFKEITKSFESIILARKMIIAILIMCIIE